MKQTVSICNLSRTPPQIGAQPPRSRLASLRRWHSQHLGQHSNQVVCIHYWPASGATSRDKRPDVVAGCSKIPRWPCESLSPLSDQIDFRANIEALCNSQIRVRGCCCRDGVDVGVYSWFCLVREFAINTQHFASVCS